MVVVAFDKKDARGTQEHCGDDDQCDVIQGAQADSWLSDSIFRPFYLGRVFAQHAGGSKMRWANPAATSRSCVYSG